MIILFALISQLIYSLLLLYFYSTGTKRLKNKLPPAEAVGLQTHIYSSGENFTKLGTETPESSRTPRDTEANHTDSTNTEYQRNVTGHRVSP